MDYLFVCLYAQFSLALLYNSPAKLTPIDVCRDKHVTVPVCHFKGFKHFLTISHIQLNMHTR
jgi:hypothetical protein